MAISAGSTILQSDLMVPFSVTWSNTGHYSSYSAQGYKIGSVCFINFSFTINETGYQRLNKTVHYTSIFSVPYTSKILSTCVIGTPGYRGNVFGVISANGNQMTIHFPYIYQRSYKGQIIYIDNSTGGTVPTANNLVRATDFDPVTFTPTAASDLSGTLTGWKCGNLLVVNFYQCYTHIIYQEGRELCSIPYTTIPYYQGIACLTSDTGSVSYPIPYINILPQSSSIVCGSAHLQPAYTYSGQIITFV